MVDAWTEGEGLNSWVHIWLLGGLSLLYYIYIVYCEVSFNYTGFMEKAEVGEIVSKVVLRSELFFF